MRANVTPTPALCARFHHASELIGRRWNGAIIFVLLKSRCRFATLRHAIPDITDRMLCERLQELELEGIVERTVVPETPVRVEYALTRSWSAKLEYDLMDFGTSNIVFSNSLGSFTTDIKQNIQTVKFGLNYKFDWGGPVSASY